MASARFRIGTATTNSAGTVWSWRAYDAAADIASGSYVKVDLETTNGVRKLACTIPSADDVTLAGTLPTVTTVQASKTATFQSDTGAARTYVVRAQINDGIDLNGDTVSGYTKQLAVHIKTGSGRRLIAVGERDEADRTNGYTPKLNAAIKTTAGALGSSGVAAGTYTLATVTVSSTGVITSAATGAGAGLGSSGVVAGTYTNTTITVSSTGVITSAATGAAGLSSSGVAAGTYTLATVTVSSTGVITSAGTGSIGSSGVAAGTYTLSTITVGTDGRITSAATGAASGVPTGSVNQVIQYDASGSAQSTSIITLASVATPSTVASKVQIYCSGGALLALGGSGTKTVIAPA